MPNKVLLVVHQEASDPGRVGAVLKSMGLRLDIRRPPLGHELPASLDDHAAAVIFGGPMSANDDHLPFIRAEIDWIGKVITSGKPFLGICLGAQMLARLLGARVSAHPDGLHEIGYYPVWPTDAGRGIIDDGLNVYQWHGEGFELPRGCELLARGQHFPNQAYRYGVNAFGLQFHPEVTGVMRQRWCTRAAHRLVLPGAQSRETQQQAGEQHDGAISDWLGRFARHWLASGGEPAPALAAGVNGAAR